MAEEVKLFGMWTSPFSLRIEIALKLKGIKYEYIEEDLSNKSPLLLNYNPIHKKVPVFVHNGNPIPESLVILDYIDETWKNRPLLPQDPYQRAMARFWAKVIDDKLLQVVRLASTKEGDEQKDAIEEFQNSLKMLEKELEGKDFFGGQDVGYLDIVANLVAFWCPRMQEVVEVELLTEHKFPVLFKWIEKLSDVEVFQECCPPREAHIALIKKRWEEFKAAPK